MTTAPVDIPPLFLTGGSGFVGREVLALLARVGATDVRILSRTPVPSAERYPTSWRWIPGALARADGRHPEWRSGLIGAHTVLHLASSTGKASAAVHAQQIVGGTRELLEAATDAGVERFCYVSSVAAGFADQTGYHYGRAKLAAEGEVRRWRGASVVLRPTMVFGAGSPVLQGLQRLAGLPVPVLFGNGQARVAPIDVRDLASVLVAAVAARVPYDGSVHTVAGPETVTLEALYTVLRRATGATPRTPLHVPVPMLRALLRAAEPVLLPVLPVTAGQLASFVNDSVGPAHAPWLAARHAESAQLTGAPRRLTEMLDQG